MGSWGDVLHELQQTPGPNGVPDFDRVRRKYLAALAAHTSRPTIVYATDFLSGSAVDPSVLSINLGDMQALMEVVRGLPGPNLDLILHTPGGSPEALESLVRYLRTQFDHIRAFVPLAAMSAGTMWALACDEIVMGKHSQLGPIDPQFPLAFGEQIRLAPAQAILDQFEHAVEQTKKDPNSLPGWITVLRSYGPSLLQECYRAQQLSESLVSHWLAAYMFKGEPGATDRAEKAAKFFADYQTHYSHGRPIDRDQAKAYDIKVRDLEDDQDLQDAVLTAHHAVMHTLTGTAVAKLVENHEGRAFAVLSGQVAIVPNPTGPAQPQPGGQAAPGQPGAPIVPAP